MIAVVVASLGRPENLAMLLDRLALQTHLPSQVVMSLESDADAPPPADFPFIVDRIFGPRGTCVQRNRGLDMLSPDIRIVVFYDDDFVPSRFAIEGIERFFSAHPDISGASGLVLKDGIKGPGISPTDALTIMNNADATGNSRSTRILKAVDGLYGCNMAFQVARIAGLRFDERLVLYGWFEDLDFGGQVKGPIVQTDAFIGVHCGEKRGRETNGRRLGYSQVANPVYMVRKGTMKRRQALRAILRRVVMNHIRMFRPEPWIDRRGRMAGNWIAILDALKRQSRPNRILDL